MLLLLIISALGNIAIAYLVWLRGAKTSANRWFVGFALTVAFFVATNILWMIYGTFFLDMSTWATGFVAAIIGSLWTLSLTKHKISKWLLVIHAFTLVLVLLLIYIGFNINAIRVRDEMYYTSVKPDVNFFIYCLMLMSVMVGIFYRLVRAYLANVKRSVIRSIFIGTALFMAILIPNSVIAPFIIGHTYDPILDTAASVFLLFFLAYATAFQGHAEVQWVIKRTVVRSVVLATFVGGSAYMVIFVGENLLPQELATNRIAAITATVVLSALVGQWVSDRLLTRWFNPHLPLVREAVPELSGVHTFLPNFTILAEEIADGLGNVLHAKKITVILRHPASGEYVAAYPADNRVLLPANSELLHYAAEHPKKLLTAENEPQISRELRLLNATAAVAFSAGDLVLALVLFKLPKEAQQEIKADHLANAINELGEAVLESYRYWEAITRAGMVG